MAIGRGGVDAVRGDRSVATLDRYLRMKPPVIYIFEHFAYRLPAALHEGLPVVCSWRHLPVSR